MIKNYDYMKFAEKDFPASRTLQNAALSIQQYLSLVSSGTPVPVHRVEYQSELVDEDLKFEDLDRTRTSGTDLYDVQDSLIRERGRRIEAARRAQSEPTKEVSESAPKEPIKPNAELVSAEPASA